MKLTTLARIWLTKSWEPFVFLNEYDEKLNVKNTEPLGLYVHIPFCKSICSFCPYCKVNYEKDTAMAYKNALIKEIELVGSSLEEPKTVTSLYFGGGTPALLVDFFAEIISAIAKYFTITEGIGVELHPENVNKETLQKLKSAGVTKISIGIQSFQKESLMLLGRKEPNYESVFHALHEVPFETVSMDLIFAIPGQTGETLKQDIQMAFENGADQIAIYPFIDFTFSKNTSRPMPEKEKKRLLEEITKYCEEKDYVRTSIWTFAKQGAEKYSSMTRDNFLGFGCSAATLLKEQFKINTFSIAGYIERIENGQLPTSLTLRFSIRQRMVYYLFWNAYTMIVDPKAFKQFFGVSLRSKYGFEFFICRILGLVKKRGRRYVLTGRGAYNYHYFEQFYTLSYIDQMWNISGKTAFPDKVVLE